MGINRKGSFSKKIIFFVVSILLASLISYAIYHQTLDAEVSEASINPANYPITGTFVMFDYPMNSGATSLEMIKEMKSYGIDTFIILATSWSRNEGCPADPNLRYESMLNMPGVKAEDIELRNFLLNAKAEKVKVYLGTTALEQVWTCINPYESKYFDSIFSNSIRGINEIRNFLGEETWNSGLIEGIYISGVELDLTHAGLSGLSHYKDLSYLLKTEFPDKKILFSPYKYEKSTSDELYALFKKYFSETKIDIIAPQDSGGTGKTQSVLKNREHFQALKRAADETGKVAWANIEPFNMTSDVEDLYTAANFERVKGQIDSVDGLVSKQIQWIFQHTMTTNPNLVNVSTWSKAYTNINYINRLKLVSAYREFYGEQLGFPYIFEMSGNIVYKSTDLRKLGNIVKVNVTYIDNTDTVVSKDLNITLKQEGEYSVAYVPRAQLPGFVSMDKTAISVHRLGGTNTPTPTPTSINTPTPIPTTVVKNQFSDLPETHWAYSSVNELYNKNIVSGCSTNPLQYCPTEEITRGAVAVMLLKMKYGGNYNPPAATGQFSDVAKDHWAAPWSEQLAREGISSGCGSGRFCPDGAVTRAQFALLLSKTTKGSNFNPPACTESVFSDVQVSDHLCPFIHSIYNEGLISGCGTSPLAYCPNRNVTRAEVAVIIQKALPKMVTPTPKATNTPKPTSKPTNTPIPKGTNTPKPSVVSKLGEAEKIDMDKNGIIDIRDYQLFVTYYKDRDKRSDLNNDSEVNIEDFIIFRTLYTKHRDST
jgi:hypothetical protein